MNDIKIKFDFEEIDYHEGNLLRDMDYVLWILGRQETNKNLWVAIRLKDGSATQCYEQASDLVVCENLIKVAGNFTMTLM